jgi:phosphoribosylanthranilate isomerase
VTLGQARALAAEVPGARWVGVFVHEPIELIAEAAVALGLHAVQLHRTATEGDSDRLPVPLWRAIQVRGPQTAPEIAAAVRLGPVLLDAFVAGREGGTGKTFDHALARPHFGAGTVMIAGGLNPGNIAGIAASLAATPPWPYAFDVSSGLESEPGVKDHARVRAFFAELSSGWASGRRE